MTILSLVVAAVYGLKEPKFYEASTLVRLHEETPQGSPAPQAETLDLKTATLLVKTFLTAQEALKLVREGKLASMRVSESVRRHLSSLSPQDVLESVRVKSYEPDLIRISVRHALPEVSAVLANSVAEAFIARLRSEILAETADEHRFIESQLPNLHAGLQRVDKQVLEVERELSAINVPSEAWTLVNFAKIFATELMMVEADVREVIRASERLSQNPTEERNFDLKAKHVAFRQWVFELERRREELDERRKLLGTLLQQAHRQLRKFPEQQRKLSDLVRQLQVLGQAYMSLLSRLQDAQVKGMTGFSGATIVTPAVVPNEPANLDLTLLLLIALSGSLAVGIGMSLLLEFAKGTVTRASEVEGILGAPILSVIPEARLKADIEGLMRLMASRHGVAEAIRTLRSNLRFTIMRQSGERAAKVFLITSSVKGEGKSFVSAALGLAFAQLGKRVVIVDADLLNPSLHRFLGVDDAVGLADVLKGVASLDDALRETKAANLQLLPAGRHGKGATSITPAELLNSEAMLNLLHRLEERFDLVLIDTPPIAAVADPCVLAPLVDGVLLVVELGRVTRTAIQGVKEQLELAQAKVVGAVVNKASQKRGHDFPRDYYHYLGSRFSGL